MNQQVRFDPASARRKVPAATQNPVTWSWRRNLPLGISGGCALMAAAAIGQSISFGVENLSWFSLGTPFVLGMAATLLMLRLMQRNLGEQRRQLEREFAERTAELLKTEKRFAEYGETAKEWFWETDTEDRIVFLSSRFFEASGIRPEEIIGRRRELLRTEPLSDADRDMWADYRHRIDNRLPFEDLRYTSLTKDGKEIVYCSSGKPFFDDDGCFLGYRGTARDATGEVAEERRRRADQDLIYNATAVLNDGFYIFDADDRLMMCNPRFKEIYAEVADLLEPGVPYEKILRAIAEKQLVFASDQEREAWITETLIHHAGTAHTFEERLASGEWIRVVKQRMPDGNLVGLCVDISSIKQTEEELSEAQRITNTGSYRMDFVSGRMSSISPQLAKIYGVDEATLLEADDPFLYDFVHSADRERVRQAYQSASGRQGLSTGDLVFEIEYRMRRADGELRHIVERTSASKIDDGRVSEVIGTLADVTERRKTEQELEAAQKIAHVGSFRWDVPGDRASSFSAEIGNIFGRPLNEIVRMSDQEFAERILHPEDRERVLDAYEEAIEQGEGYAIEYRILRPDGEERQVIERAQVVDHRGDRVIEYLGMFQDVTDERFIERELEKAQEIARVGNFRWNMEQRRMESFSRQYLRIYGRSAKEMEELGIDGLISQVIHPNDRQRVRETFARAESHDEPYQIEYRIRRPDGEYRHIVERCDISARRDGKPVEQLGTLQDVTDLRQFEQELENAQRLARIGSFRWDSVNQRVISGSSEYLRILGRAPDELPQQGDNQFEITHPDDRERLREWYRQSAETGEEMEVEYRLQRRDGELRYVSERLRTLVWKDAKPVEQIGTLQDITERKLVERELEDAQRLARIGSFRWDVRQGRLISCSDQYLEILGLSSEFLMSLRNDQFETWVHEEDIDRLLAAYERIDETGEDLEIEYRILRSDGEVRNVIERIGVSAWLFGKPAEQIGTLQDITERRRFEHQLEEAQRIAGVGSFRYSLGQGRYLSVSAELVRIYGRSEEELLAIDEATLIELTVHPDDRERVAACYAESDRTGEEYRIEFRMLHPGGGVRRIVEHAEPLLLQDGRVVEQIGTMQDITERRLFEKELEAAQSIARIGSFRWDVVNYKLMHLSDEFARIHGSTVEELWALTESEDPYLTSFIHPDDRQRLIDLFDEHDSSGEPYEVAYKLLRSDGEIRHIVEFGDPIKSHDGKILEFRGIIQDVTEYRRIEQELEEAQAVARVGSFRWDKQRNRLISCSAEYLNILGRSEEAELAQRDDQFDLVHPEDRARVLETYARDFDGDAELVYRLLREDGEVRIVSERLRPHLWRDGVLVEQIGTIQDITERKLVEQELEDAQHLAGIGSFRWNVPQGRLISCSAAYLDIFGCSGDFMMSLREGQFDQLVHPEDLERLNTAYRHIDATGEDLEIEYRILRTDGEVRNVVERLQVSQQRDGVFLEQIGTVQDVTERRQSQQALEEAQRLARTGSYRWDLVQDQMISCTPELLRIFDVTRDHVLNRSVDELQGMDIHPEDRERVLSVYASCAKSRGVTEIEYRHVTPQGEIRYLVERLRTSVWRGNTPIEQIGTVQDVTERRQVEMEKRASDDVLEAAIENVPGGFLMIDEQGTILRFNRRFFDLYPQQKFYVNEGLPYRRFLDYGVERGVYAEAGDDPEAWLNRRPELSTTEQIEFIERLSDGRSIQIATRRLPNGIRVGIHVDVTELESARLAAERANAAKSDFLASMSHELRTPMHGILSFAELGLKRMETLSQEKLRQYLENIQVSGNRLLFLLNDLLDLSKLEAGKMSLDLAPLNLVDLIHACINEQKLQLQENRLDCDFVSDESGARCRCDRNRIHQVVANVLSNAIKFSPEGGCIEIGLSAIDGGFRIEVADQGIGIPADELDQVFDRFYQSARSRNHSGGTGLGLAICREIIGLHGGRIWAENNRGQGTRILFELPA